MRRYFLVINVLGFVLMSASAQAEPVTSPKFCSAFKSSAISHCTARGVPYFLCHNVKVIYSLMTTAYGTVKRACEHQHDTSPQSCIDAWKCYRTGGTDSHGHLCNSTGTPCP